MQLKHNTKCSFPISTQIAKIPPNTNIYSSMNNKCVLYFCLNIDTNFTIPIYSHHEINYIFDWSRFQTFQSILPEKGWLSILHFAKYDKPYLWSIHKNANFYQAWVSAISFTSLCCKTQWYFSENNICLEPWLLFHCAMYVSGMMKKSSGNQTMSWFMVSLV